MVVNFINHENIKDEKCLVSEAMEKCNCSWCIFGREMTAISTTWVIQQKMLEIQINAMKEAKIL